MATRTVHVMISGRVQGVGYRAWTAREAERRGLSGWVCNRRDGSVEAVFSGERFPLRWISFPFGHSLALIAAKRP